jgi:hypothetical protein
MTGIGRVSFKKSLLEKRDVVTGAELEHIQDGMLDFVTLAIKRGKHVMVVGEQGSLDVAKCFPTHEESMRRIADIHREGNAVANSRVYPDVFYGKVFHRGCLRVGWLVNRLKQTRRKVSPRTSIVDLALMQTLIRVNEVCVRFLR